jgi:hypothetical protein
MAKLYNLARMSTATTGTTATISLFAAVSGFLSFAAAGVQDGDIVSYGITDGSSSEVGWGKYTAAGTALTRNPIASTNSNNPISLSGAAQVFITGLASDFHLPDNYLSGLTLSNDGTSPNTVIDVAAGVAADAGNVELMRLTSAITKSISSTWAVGSGNGGLDSGSVAASTWYHVWLIRRPDTGVVDALISTSATGPTLPTNYTQQRRIGSIKTDGSSHIVAFVQNGNEFVWNAFVTDFDVTNPGTSAITRTLTVPTGIKVRARGSIAITLANSLNSACHFLISDLAISDQTVNFNGPSQVGADNASTSVNSVSSGTFAVWTNTSAQVRTRAEFSDSTTRYTGFTWGWDDLRGQ